MLTYKPHPSAPKALCSTRRQAFREKDTVSQSFAVSRDKRYPTPIGCALSDTKMLTSNSQSVSCARKSEAVWEAEMVEQPGAGGGSGSGSPLSSRKDWNISSPGRAQLRGVTALAPEESRGPQAAGRHPLRDLGRSPQKVMTFQAGAAKTTDQGTCTAWVWAAQHGAGSLSGWTE